MDDYYNKARGFPITYSPEDDPEVVEEMKIAEAELKRGGNGEENGGLDPESSSEDSTSGEEDEDGEDGWVDEDGDSEDGGADQSEKRKRKRKVLSCVDKVRDCYQPCSSVDTECLFISCI